MRRYNRKLPGIILGVVLLIGLLPLPVSAMAGMYTAKYVDGPNVITLTNNVHTTQATVPTTYNIRLYNVDGQPVYFSNARLTLLRGQQSIEEHNLRRTRSDDTRTTITFSRQGTYTLRLQFLDNNKQVAEGVFPIVVQKNPHPGWLSQLFTWQTGLGAIVGAGAITAITRDKKRVK